MASTRKDVRTSGDGRRRKETSRNTDLSGGLPVEFSRSLPMLLMRGREAVMRYFRPGLRQHGLTELQWRVLRALTHYGPLEATELARVTILHLPSLSRVLRDLESRKIVERIQVKTDLRRSQIQISPKGMKLIRAIAPSSQLGYASIAQRFGARRLKILQTMLLQLESSLGNGQFDEVDGIGPAAASTPRGRLKVSRSESKHERE